MIKHIIELNGLRLCKSETGSLYKVIHLATSKDLGLVAKRLKDIKPFFQDIAPRFPWPEWNTPGEIPIWANDAFNAVLCARLDLNKIKGK